MKPIILRAAAALTLTFAIAACVPRTAPPPRPAPSPVATPAPVVTPPAPTFSNWMDAPATPGNWTYQPAQGGSAAIFGEPGLRPRLTLRCDRSQRRVHLEQPGGNAAENVIIRTETSTRTIASTTTAGSEPVVRTSLPAGDRLLDAMALSKGRFALEVPGSPTLYIPAWPEVTRVIEDCRA